MSSRQEQFSGTRPVRDDHAIDEQRLHDYLAEHLDGFKGPLQVRQFKGGQSNPTYLLEAQSARYVLRRKPPGKLLKSAHAVEREYRIIKALYDTGFPVPEPYLLCEDDDIVGTTFFVMAFVEGRIIWELDLPGMQPAERAAIYDDMNRVIAELHTIDYRALGLEDFGKPGNYFERQISRWTKQYRLSETGAVPAMDFLIEWLPQNIPDDDASSIVHGDYRMDNLILHPTEPRIIAVLDWELSTIGHPLGDFTYHLMAWQMPEVGFGSAGLQGKDLVSLGIPSEDEYVRRYCERCDRSESIAHREFYAAYNLFRIAAILQGIAGRVRDGTASSDHAAKATRAVGPLAELGQRYAKS
ncbi:MAG: phosphotransferase family protein [Woeseia sp.]|nr:phosphotransferase family protein [Woeseia sp.]MBT8095936.1 phosphotransferase family protein [Woeseia sp.]NNE61082.1 phosphotransferase family protein [Woeseia sp.]NNL53762.1 phosphotransferase family protein [Woeseia sp.]